MAVVFEAMDTRHHRSVALKVILPEVAADLGVDRFLREIRTLAALQHRGIVPLFDSGVAEGIPYYVMPIIAGESLRARLDRDKQLPLGDALGIAGELTEALDFAHRSGVVHRDVKPENILLADSHAVLADFGIARAIGLSSGTKLTQTGVSLGTPHYMSPEQAAAGVVDARSDIYSLGCVVHEMLVGEPPFTGPTAEGVVRQHLVLEPRAVSDLRPSTPPAVSRTILRALAKAPADRFQSATEFGAALSASAAEPVSAWPPAVPAVSAEARRRGKPAFVRLAVVVFALLAVVAAYWAFTPSAPGSKRASEKEGASRRPVLVAEFEGAKIEPAVALAARQLVMAALDQSDRLEAVASDQIKMALELAGKPDTARVDGALARELAFRNGIKVTVEGRIDQMGGAYRIALTARDADDGHVLHTESGRARDEDALIPTLGRLTARLRQALGERAPGLTLSGPRWVAATPSFEAYKKYSRAFEMQQLEGDDRGSIELLRETLAIDPDFAEAWALKCFAHGHLGEEDSSNAALAQALKRPERLTEEGRMFLQGIRDITDGNFVAADAKYRELIRRGYQLSSSLGNHASVLWSAGRYREALQEARRAAHVSPVGPQQWVLGGLVELLLMFDEVPEARIEAAGLKGFYADRGGLAIAVAAGEWNRADSLSSEFESDPTRDAQTRRIAAFVSAGLAASRGSRVEAWALLARAGEPVASIMLDLACGTLPVRAPGAAPVEIPASNHLALGFAAIARRDLAGARRELADLPSADVAAAPGSENGRVLLEACIIGREGRWDEAAKLLAPLARLGERPGIRVRPVFERWLAGDAFEQSGQPDSAAVYFERALDPSGLFWETRVLVRMLTPYVHLRLARLCAQLGWPADAEAHRAAGRALLVDADTDVRSLLNVSPQRARQIQ